MSKTGGGVGTNGSRIQGRSKDQNNSPDPRLASIPDAAETWEVARAMGAPLQVLTGKSELAPYRCGQFTFGVISNDWRDYASGEQIEATIQQVRKENAGGATVVIEFDLGDDTTNSAVLPRALADSVDLEELRDAWVAHVMPID